MTNAATTTRRISSRMTATGNNPKASDVVPGLADLGTNLTYTLDGDHLVLRIDLSQRHGKSASGKTTIVATSSGNQKIPGTDVIIGVNLYTKE